MSTPICAKCPFDLKDRKCFNSNGKSPAGCPTKEFSDVKDEILDAYKDEELKDFYLFCSDLSGDMKSRIEETLMLASSMKYKRLGLAFCAGLRKEAAIVNSFFERKGFEVVSVICRCGNIKKGDFVESDDPKENKKGFCNPMLQARVLNEAKAEWNIVLGLCVGHDSIFMKYSKAMCTVLAAKDRVSGHNPLAPVYTMDSYYSFLKK